MNEIQKISLAAIITLIQFKKQKGENINIDDYLNGNVDKSMLGIFVPYSLFDNVTEELKNLTPEMKTEILTKCEIHEEQEENSNEISNEVISFEKFVQNLTTSFESSEKKSMEHFLSNVLQNESSEFFMNKQFIDLVLSN
jgi:hypothetical protein